MRGGALTAPSRVTPATSEEVAQTVRAADAAGEAIVIRGGDTLRGMGFPAQRADLELSTEALRALITHDVRDLTCAAEAGMPLTTLSDALAKEAQFVPLDAPLPQRATLGGTLAAGWLGPRRHAYGRARDFVIGSQAVLANGSLVHAGGMVVKNVTGYDMSKLYAGSFGTLALLVRINCKTIPVPQRTRAFVAPLPRGSRARAIAHVRGLIAAPAAAFCVEGFRKEIDGSDGIDGRLLAFYEGSEELIERATRDLRSALGKAGVPDTAIVDAGAKQSFQRTLDATIACIAKRSVTYRSLGPPQSVETRALALRDTANRRETFTDVLADIMNGDAFVRVSRRDARAFDACIEQLDAEIHQAQPHAVVVAGESMLRSSLRVWGADPPTIDKMRALKTRFDPKGTFNPGRFVGGI